MSFLVFFSIKITERSLKKIVDWSERFIYLQNLTLQSTKSILSMSLTPLSCFIIISMEADTSLVTFYANNERVWKGRERRVSRETVCMRWLYCEKRKFPTLNYKAERRRAGSIAHHRSNLLWIVSNINSAFRQRTESSRGIKFFCAASGFLCYLIKSKICWVVKVSRSVEGNGKEIFSLRHFIAINLFSSMKERSDLEVGLEKWEYS